MRLHWNKFLMQRINIRTVKWCKDAEMHVQTRSFGAADASFSKTPHHWLLPLGKTVLLRVCIHVIRLHQAYSQHSCTFLLSCCTKYISGFLFTFGEHLNICHWILKEREGSSPAPTWNYASRVFQIVLLRSLPLVPSLHNIISGLRFWITLSFQCSCQRDRCPLKQPARKQMQIIG